MKLETTLIKYLSFGLKAKSGINFSGRKTFLRKINKTKKNYRIIDFYKTYRHLTAIVVNIQHDPNRTAPIALICYKNGMLSYILSISGLKPNFFIDPSLFTLGSTHAISQLLSGTLISNIEVASGHGAKYIRSAGSYGLITNRFHDKAILKLPSGQERFVCLNSLAVIGRIDNIYHYLKKNIKASDSLYKLGQKPAVRGVAKNAVDHPHGGGRGRTSNLATAVNFTGRVKKGVSSKSKKQKNYNLKKI